MKSLNRATLIGNLTADPTFKTTAKGAFYCYFSIATDRSWITSDGEKREEADFHNVVAWDSVARTVEKLLRKGDLVYVEGRLNNRLFKKEDGSEIPTTEIVLTDFTLLNKKD